MSVKTWTFQVGKLDLPASLIGNWEDGLKVMSWVVGEVAEVAELRIVGVFGVASSYWGLGCVIVQNGRKGGKKKKTWI